jgi:nucleoside 2-deoxyribosyltransferase
VNAVYVASPLGFSEVGRLYYRSTLLPAVRSAGLKPLDPWAPRHARASGLTDALALPIGQKRTAALTEADYKLAEQNFVMIQQANGLLAVVDGNDVDSGTAAEIGAAAALGKPIVALRTDFRSMGDNEGTVINLQVDFFVRLHGGQVVADPHTAAKLLARLIAAR